MFGEEIQALLLQTSDDPSAPAPSRQAARQLLDSGFPTTRVEQWKYTSLRALAGKTWVMPTDNELKADVLEHSAVTDESIDPIVLHNGRLSSQPNLGDGITMLPLGEAIEQDPSLGGSLTAEPGLDAGFLNLNTALLHDGFVLLVEANRVIDEPIHIIHVGDDHQQTVMRNPRIVMRFGANSQAQVIEEFVSVAGDCGLNNTVTQLILDNNAQIAHHRVQGESESASHLGRVEVDVAENANYRSDSIAYSGLLTRADVNVSLSGRGARCELYGLFIGAANQHIDHHTRVDHLVGDTHSVEHYRGILDGSSRGVFNGKVIVRPNAQHITAQQKNHNLLLSPQAEIDTKPELEIYADDVSCAHGATVGELDPAALFYLRSRGIKEEHARQLLTYAFAREMVAQLPVPGLRRWLENRFIGNSDYSELLGELSTT